jgi:hypothetical protein
MLNKRIDLQARTSDGITVDLTLAMVDDGLLVNFVVSDKEGNPLPDMKATDDPFAIIQLLNEHIGAITELATALEAKAKLEAH